MASPGPGRLMMILTIIGISLSAAAPTIPTMTEFTAPLQPAGPSPEALPEAANSTAQEGGAIALIRFLALYSL